MDPKTFEIRITGRENAEWQGSLKPDDGTASDFCSILELLAEMEKHLGEENPSVWEIAPEGPPAGKSGCEQ